jgi:phosphomannomutase
MWADLLVLDMVAYFGKTLEQIWEETQILYGRSTTEPINLTVPDERKVAFIDSFLDEARKGSLAGMRVVFAGGIAGKYAEVMLEDEDGCADNFLHIRPSGTEPLIRIYLETASDRALSSLRERIDLALAAIK